MLFLFGSGFVVFCFWYFGVVLLGGFFCFWRVSRLGWLGNGPGLLVKLAKQRGRFPTPNPSKFTSLQVKIGSLHR